MDHMFELYIVATGLSRGTDRLRYDYCVGIDYCTLPDILEGSGFMISAPYRRLEGNRFMDSVHYCTGID